LRDLAKKLHYTLESELSGELNTVICNLNNQVQVLERNELTNNYAHLPYGGSRQTFMQ